MSQTTPPAQAAPYLDDVEVSPPVRTVLNAVLGSIDRDILDGNVTITAILSDALTKAEVFATQKNLSPDHRGQLAQVARDIGTAINPLTSHHHLLASEALRDPHRQLPLQLAQRLAAAAQARLARRETASLKAADITPTAAMPQPQLMQYLAWRMVMSVALCKVGTELHI